MPYDAIRLSLHEDLDFDFGLRDIEGAARACRALLETEILAMGEATSGGSLELRGRAGSLGVGREEEFGDLLQQELTAAGLFTPEIRWIPEPPGSDQRFRAVFTIPLTNRYARRPAREGDLLAVSGEPGDRAALRSLARAAGGWDRLLEDPPVGADRALERERRLVAPRDFASLLDRSRMRGTGSLARGLPAAAASLAVPLGAEIWVEELPVGSPCYRASERERCQPWIYAVLEAGEPELLMALEPAEYFSLERRAMARGLRVAVIGRIVKEHVGLCRAAEGGVPVPLPAPRRLAQDENERGDE